MSDPVRSRRRALGRGLDALLATTARPGPIEDGGEESLFSEVSLDAIAPNPEQPRAAFDEAALAELAESIRMHGLLQPIVVESDGRGGYRLIAGERRLRAARLAGLPTLPAIIRPATESSRHALELALVENLHRSDLNALEEASAYARLADAFGLSHEAIGLRVGRSRSAVANTLRLLQLPASIQEALAAGRITAGHARALLALATSAAQERMAARIDEEGLSVRDVEHAVRIEAESLLAGEAAPPAVPSSTTGRAAAAPVSIDDDALVRGLEQALGTPVRLERRRRGGRLVIDFFDDEQLDGLYTRLGGPQL